VLSGACHGACNAILHSLAQMLHASPGQLLAQAAGSSGRPGSPLPPLLLVIKRGTVQPINVMAQWKQDAILKLIGSYRARRFLWDYTASDYTDRNKRIDAWKEIADEVAIGFPSLNKYR